MQASRMLILGASLGGAAVALGAFAAHGLRDRLSPEHLANFETGARYQMYHALALCLCGLLALQGARLRLASWSFVAGILLFSGSLYGFALTQQPWLVFLTPVGGTLFLLGWGALACACRGSAFLAANTR